MNALDLIRRKHAGRELSSSEIDWLVREAVAGKIPDYQLSALLMVISYEHLSFDETVALTRAFVASGETLSWPGELGIFIDKHSTGGVGDKVSLILIPLLASLGFKVAKMSGRALGFTGGTIDKLESIPGFRTNLSREEMLQVAEDAGCCVVEQSADLVPADKLFYSLRDATDTVEEIGLIAASVMSKKIACGAPYIVLDVKCGSSAFFKTLDRAREFAQIAKRIGGEFGRKVGCVITNMDQPLGCYIGNRSEVSEAAFVLKHPDFWREHRIADLIEVVISLAAVAQVLAGSSDSLEEGREVAATALYSKKPYGVFTRWVAAQGGDLSAFEAAVAENESGWDPVTTDQRGYVTHIDGVLLGNIVHRLASEASAMGKAFTDGFNIDLEAKVGEGLLREDRNLLLMMQNPAGLHLTNDLKAELRGAFKIADAPPVKPGIVLDVIL